MFNHTQKTITNIILIFVVLFVSNIIAAFLFGILLTVGGNIQTVGLNKLAFDPLITIAYMMLFYFLSLFFQPSARAQFYIFLFTLFLSFTVSFIQGAIYLVVLYFLLRKVNII